MYFGEKCWIFFSVCFGPSINLFSIDWKIDDGFINKLKKIIYWKRKGWNVCRWFETVQYLFRSRFNARKKEFDQKTFFSVLPRDLGQNCREERFRIKSLDFHIQRRNGRVKSVCLLSFLFLVEKSRKHNRLVWHMMKGSVF